MATRIVLSDGEVGALVNGLNKHIHAAEDDWKQYRLKTAVITGSSDEVLGSVYEKAYFC